MIADTDTDPAVVVTSLVGGVVVVTSLVGVVVVVSIPEGNVVVGELFVTSVVEATVLIPVTEMVVDTEVLEDDDVVSELEIVDWVPVDESPVVVVDKFVSSLQEIKRTAKNEKSPNIRIFLHASFICIHLNS